ncbi:MAG: bifunctional phosphopantothenoylcysteine decarboxylase/phosphopantothenate--cysteine ligase CoaBC [Flavobacteriales bacterium]|nr:bifunctional phosphopantothenoylcysteine decarboxylase/phosphopantothenate--cysteine ligase CoaBC [Flavobacteriales bacterium]|tara:strand:- start:5873 stop:7069 length:1197 start_codon:yes stop_codon:yes gene_type:complete
MLKGKKVLLGISASIAAYKAADLVRLLTKLGASVKVIQTEASLHFIAPLTLSTLSKNQVLSKMVDQDTNDWNNHVELGLWADLMVIAPATANTIAKMVIGECDNLLLATYLSAKCPVYFAPAMDLDMYQHPSTSDNIKKLESYHNKLIPSGFGELASGLFGEGRMAEPLEIVEYIISDLSKDLPLSGIQVLVTAGPTYEAIDPVRYIGNRSSGKMGIELALECANNGAKVNLVLGPTHLECKHPNIIIHRIESAKEMYDVVKKHFINSKISIFAAAVSDYSSEVISENKIKKSQKRISISLIKTIDILSEMSSCKKDSQFVVGFALETENEVKNAKEKLKRKGLDMIVLNSLNNEGAGFQSDTNKITIIEKGNNIIDFDLKNKSEVAKDIVARIIELK